MSAAVSQFSQTIFVHQCIIFRIMFHLSLSKRTNKVTFLNRSEFRLLYCYPIICVLDPGMDIGTFI
jgi:hypothetical protein